MKNSVWLWALAFVITAASASYQRMTGPTYPVKGTVRLGGSDIKYQLPRSHGGTTDCPVEISAGSQAISGTLKWKRHNTRDELTNVEMASHGATLSASLPNQPPAGKLDYAVELRSGGETVTLPQTEMNVIRFKGEVPLWVLIPHVIAMFGGMLLSTRAGLEMFRANRKLKPLILATLGFLIVGGFALGPMVQKYAFDAYWTGWPFGHDLTDNKTAAAILAWLVAYAMLTRSGRPERWAMGAAVVTMIVFMIPHSVLGSELKYDESQPSRPTSVLIR